MFAYLIRLYCIWGFDSRGKGIKNARDGLKYKKIEKTRKMSENAQKNIAIIQKFVHYFLNM
jgi:hypothetical protein